MLRNVDLKIKKPTPGHQTMSALFWFAGPNHHPYPTSNCAAEMDSGKALCAAGCRVTVNVRYTMDDID